jgi:Ras-related protein Rab-40
MAVEPRAVSQQKQYDYLLKFLLVGDSDVGKQEILSELEDGSTESHFCSGGGKNCKCTDG